MLGLQTHTLMPNVKTHQFPWMNPINRSPNQRSMIVVPYRPPPITTQGQVANLMSYIVRDQSIFDLESTCTMSTNCASSHKVVLHYQRARIMEGPQACAHRRCDAKQSFSYDMTNCMAKRTFVVVYEKV